MSRFIDPTTDFGYKDETQIDFMMSYFIEINDWETLRQYLPSQPK